VMKSYLGAIVENKSRMRRESRFSGGTVRRNGDYNRRREPPRPAMHFMAMDFRFEIWFLHRLGTTRSNQPPAPLLAPET